MYSVTTLHRFQHFIVLCHLYCYVRFFILKSVANVFHIWLNLCQVVDLSLCLLVDTISCFWDAIKSEQHSYISTL